MFLKRSCQCCEHETNAFVQLNPETVVYSCVEIAMNRQGMFRVRTYPNGTENGFDLMEFTNINYCPICGRRIKK